MDHNQQLKQELVAQAAGLVHLLATSPSGCFYPQKVSFGRLDESACMFRVDLKARWLRAQLCVITPRLHSGMWSDRSIATVDIWCAAVL